MTAFLAEQSDFIFFFYGLAFVLLGITCFAISRSAGAGSAWALLGLFGLIHGASEWLDLSALVIGDGPTFFAFRTAVMAASYVALLEFARRNLQRRVLWTPGGWIYVPLVLFVVLAAVGSGFGVANALSRYAIGLSGAVATGFVFVLHGKDFTGREQRLAFMAAVGWVLYGIAAGVIVPAAPFWPASVLNQRWFLDETGLPIQLVRGLIACGLAGAIWGLWGQTLISKVSSVRYTRFVHRQFFVTCAAMAVILLCGWALTEFFGGVHKQHLKEESRGKLDLLAASLAGETAPVDAVVRSLAGAPAVRAFLSNRGPPAADRSDRNTIKSILALGVVASGAQRGYLYDRTGTLVVSIDREDRRDKVIIAATPYLRHALTGKDYRHFAFDATRKQTDYLASYPIYDSIGTVVGAAVLEKSLAAFQTKISTFNTPFFLVDPQNTVALTNKAEWLEAVEKLPSSQRAVDPQLKDGIWTTAVDGRSVYVGRRPLNPSGWSLIVVSPVEGIFASRVLGIALTLLATIMVLVYIVARERAVQDHVQMDRRLELEELARDLDFKATTDPLTGLSNRLKFDQALSREIMRSRRFDVPLSLIFYDVDHFKRINDAYGHQVGDSVLTKLSGFVAGRMRSTDLLARWGGEEFAILLPLSDAPTAARFAEILKDGIGALAFDHGETVTCSFGVAQLVAGETADHFVARADEALYRAKLYGRNRVELATVYVTATPGVNSAA